MTFSYHKKYYDNNEIDLEAVENMKFATIEQSELFQKYNAEYYYSWADFLIQCLIVYTLVNFSDKCIWLMFLFIWMFLFSKAIYQTMLLKLKAYCLGLIPLPEIEWEEKIAIYYNYVIKILFLILLPIILWQSQTIYFS